MDGVARNEAAGDCPRPLLSREAPGTLVSLALSASSAVTLVLWFMCWTLFAWPQVLVSTLLMASGMLAISGLAAAIVGACNHEGALRFIVTLLVSLLAGVPSWLLLFIYVAFVASD